MTCDFLQASFPLTPKLHGISVYSIRKSTLRAMSEGSKLSIVPISTLIRVSSLPNTLLLAFRLPVEMLCMGRRLHIPLSFHDLLLLMCVLLCCCASTLVSVSLLNYRFEQRTIPLMLLPGFMEPQVLHWNALAIQPLTRLVSSGYPRKFRDCLTKLQCAHTHDPQGNACTERSSSARGHGKNYPAKRCHNTFAHYAWRAL